jgi:hypothetical protein
MHLSYILNQANALQTWMKAYLALMNLNPMTTIIPQAVPKLL